MLKINKTQYVEGEKMAKEDHLEISAGGTVIAASAKCPLEVASDEQLFPNGQGKQVICCTIQGQRQSDFVCTYFGSIVCHNGNITCICLLKD